MNEEKNITQNDMRFFQNELLNDLKKLELQLNGRVESINQLVLVKTSDYDSKFNKVFENVTELISQMAERKYYNDRVEELLKMKNKFSDQIIENQSRITIIDKSLENALFKYDKIILDNLNVPGLIGVGCKFKNCASYFKYIDNDIQANQKYKEEGVSNLKAFSEKVETRLKKSEGEINQIMANVNQICDFKFEQFFSKTEEKMLGQENMISQTRIENSKYATDLIKASTDLKIQWDKLENIKNEIYGKFDEELENFKKLVMTVDRHFKRQQEEFNIFKQRFSQLADYIKDFKNLSKNYKDMAKDIDFTKKQKLKEDFNNDKYNEISENIKEYIKSPVPVRRKSVFKINPQEDKKGEENNNERKSTKKRASLSPSPRKTAVFMKKKKMSELEKINKIAKEGNKHLTNVFSFKNKLKELNDANANMIKKDFELKRKSELNKENIETGKKVVKTLLRKKTIVTENNIDLNFDMNKENNKEISKEESDNSSFSSNLSLSSFISLKKIGEESKEEKKENKNNGFKNILNKDFKDKNKEKYKGLYSDKEEKSSEIKIISKSSKIEIDKKSEENISSTDKDKEESEKLIKKEFLIENDNKKIENKKSVSINNIKKENIKDINNKKENNINIKTTPGKIKEIPKNKKDLEILNKTKNNIKPIEKTTQINITREKSSTIYKNKDKGNKKDKLASPIATKKSFGYQKTEIRPKIKNNNNLLTLNNDSKNETSNDKTNKTKNISINNKQIKLAMNEYTSKNTNPINRTIPTHLKTEVTFPQIKTISNEINKNQNSKPQIIKMMTNTLKDNIKIRDKLILGNNSKPFVYKALLTKPRMNTNNNENKDTISASFDKKEEKDEDKEIKDNNEINNNEKDEENVYLNTNINTNSNINDNVNKEKDGNEIENKENYNIKKLFSSLYDEIKEIKDITNNNTNKETDNIMNKNAFLTSLNNVNNNYNYYYNSSDIEGNNIIMPMPNPEKIKIIDEETIKKFNNEIDFINGNIKLVNHRISTLENRYQLILTQLNNIFKSVSSYYHHHKRKMEQQNTLKLNKKKGIIKGRTIDSQNTEEILDDKKFMQKLKDLYNDDYENNEELRLNIPNDEYNKTLRRIEPFLVKKFKNN